jgi:hypothetical protein
VLRPSGGSELVSGQPADHDPVAHRSRPDSQLPRDASMGHVPFVGQVPEELVKVPTGPSLNFSHLLRFPAGYARNVGYCESHVKRFLAPPLHCRAMDEAGTLDGDQSPSIWAQVVGQLLEDARRRAGKGPALATRLEQLGVVGRGARYSESSISNWIRGRAMPPADVVLAAAKAVGISLDERVGIGHEPTDGERQLAEMRELLARQEERAAAFEERLEGVVQAVAAAKSSVEGADVESRLDRIEVQIMELQEDLTERGSRARSERHPRSSRRETEKAE